MEVFEQYGTLIMIVLLFAVFYFVLIRPQQKQQQKRQQMLDSLQKGDRVVTIGGIHGVIKEIKEETLTLRVADNVNIKVAKQGIDHIVTDEE